MATVIDFARMREVLGARSRREAWRGNRIPTGEVVLFTGVRYERYESNFENSPDEDMSTAQRKSRRKKKS